jgi:hypothetical protein
VIEGYCNGGPPPEQLWLSRVRAILVRQYLQSHFQLDSSNVGIVAMKNAPPAGVEQNPGRNLHRGPEEKIEVIDAAPGLPPRA